MQRFSLCFAVVIIGSALHLENLHKDLAWNLNNRNRSIQLSTLSTLNTHMALMQAGVLKGDPYYRNNELSWSWVALDTWKYQANFVTTRAIVSHGHTLFRCQIDTIATVSFNGQELGNTSNMHVMYEFDVTGLLRPLGQSNVVEVVIKPPLEVAKHAAEKYPYPVPESVYYHDWSEGGRPDFEGLGKGTSTHRNFVRKIASDFGWDWGPSFIPSGITSFQMVSQHVASLREATVRQQHEESLVRLRAAAHLDAIGTGTACLQAKLRQLTGNTTFHKDVCNVTFTAGRSKIEFEIDIINPALWWPVEMGEQHLYELELSLHAVAASSGRLDESTLRRRVGLRTVELVQDPLPGGTSFFFRVNGREVFAKGSNLIPADVFQPRAENKLEWILQSAVDAHMNMVRVWGGGMYQVDRFYEMADAMGLMIWQEMMFGCALYPRSQDFLDSVSEEIMQQVRRLQHHPSIVIWGGNNENEGAINWYAVSRDNQELYAVDYVALYIDTARNALVTIDPDVSFVDSSPSNGVLSVEPYVKRWGDVGNPKYGDVHYYNYNADCEDYTTYPKARFISEHGFQSFPSFAEYKQVLSEEDWFHNSSMLFYRQRHPEGQEQLQAMMLRHMRVPLQDSQERKLREKLFSDYLFLTQVQQSRCYETAFAQWRRLRSDPATKTMGILYWQLNDIWQGPSWSSIEYSGRWRLTHSAVQRSYAPVMSSIVIDGASVHTFVTSDLTHSIFVELSLELRRWNGSNVQGQPARCNVTLQAETRECPSLNLTHWMALTGCAAQSCFAHVSGLTNETPPRRCDSHAFLSELKDAELPDTRVKTGNFTLVGPRRVQFEVVSETVVVYASFESFGVVGRFVPNAMLMLPRVPVVVDFLSPDEFHLRSFMEGLTFRSLQGGYEDARDHSSASHAEGDSQVASVESDSGIVV